MLSLLSIRLQLFEWHLVRTMNAKRFEIRISKLMGLLMGDFFLILDFNISLNFTLTLIHAVADFAT